MREVLKLNKAVRDYSGAAARFKKFKQAGGEGDKEAPQYLKDCAVKLMETAREVVALNDNS